MCTEQQEMSSSYVAKLGFRATGRVIDGRAAPLFTGTKKGGKGQPF